MPEWWGRVVPGSFALFLGWAAVLPCVLNGCLVGGRPGYDDGLGPQRVCRLRTVRVGSVTKAEDQRFVRPSADVVVFVSPFSR